MMLVAALLIAGLGVVAWTVAVLLRKADAFLHRSAELQANAQGLQAELKQLKEGGFDRIISEKLNVLTQHDHQARRELVEQQRRATETVERIKTDVGGVVERLKQLTELQANVGELKDLLKPQQLRGELGEVIVRTLIAEKLPREAYEEEHTFLDGKKVEFALRLQGKLIPVDAKLQLEDFRRVRDAVDERQRQTCRTEFKRAVKRKVDEVKQYIRPEEGTFNFAMMVIPSEAVYYELVAGRDFVEDGGVSEYARQHNVTLCSPSTFWAFLSAIAEGLRGLEIERHAQDILISLQRIAGDIRDFAQDEFRLLGAHLRNASAQYDAAERALRGIKEDLQTIERVESQHPLATEEVVT